MLSNSQEIADFVKQWFREDKKSFSKFLSYMYYIVEVQEININCFIITLHLYVCMEKKRMDYL